MSRPFRTLSVTEARELLAYQGVRHVSTHRMTERILHWHYCACCGLLALNNDVTRRALRAPCVWFE